MLWFFKKKKNRYNLSTDIHSHILPSIDDGSKSLEESIEMAKEFRNIGYTKIIATPHIMADAYRNTPIKIIKILKSLQNALEKKSIDLEIEAAAEYYIDDGFLEYLNSKNVLTFGDNYLLFETSYMLKPINFEEIIFEIESRGYKAVFAHPERYRYITNLEKEYKRLKDLGVYFQINLNSLIGKYGKAAKEKAKFLINQGYVDFLGSDAHGLRHIEGVKKVINSDILETVFRKNNILNKTL